VARFKQALNPVKRERPNWGYRVLTMDGHKIECNVVEAMRGYSFHARASFKLDGKVMTWAAIAKALG
jgi:hypothetical protein